MHQEIVDVRVKDILNSKGLMWQGLLGLVLMATMFFSGFIAFGTYIFSFQHKNFIDSAISVEGKVVDLQIHKRTEKNTSANGRDLSRTYDDTILVFEFTDSNGNLNQARVNDGSQSMYKVGDTTTILYNRENPKEIMLMEKRGKGQILDKISSIAQTIFVVSFFVFLILGKRKV